jgi:hypothetical protein
VIDRRDFLIRTARAGLVIAGATAAGTLLYDPKGPVSPVMDGAGSVVLPDFSLPEANRSIAIVSGADRIKSLHVGLQALGGIDRFIKKDDRVLLKVNAAFALPPFLGATTHPDLVAEVGRICYQAGAAAVLVTDNPINDPQSCFVLSGIEAAAQSVGARVVLPREPLLGL